LALICSYIKDSVFHLTLDNPERRNALSIEMLEAISNALDEADKDKQARVIVLSGNGPVFSSGHDLKEMTASRNSEDRGRAFFDKTMRLCSSVMQKIVNHRLPVICS